MTTPALPRWLTPAQGQAQMSNALAGSSAAYGFVRQWGAASVAAVASQAAVAGAGSALLNTIVVEVLTQSSTCQQVVDSAGNTYTNLGRFTSGAVELSIWTALVLNAATLTVTAYSAANSGIAVNCAEYSGVAFATLLDASASGTGSGTAAASANTSATTGANELVLGIAASLALSAQTWTAGAGFTNRGSTGGTAGVGSIMIEDKSSGTTLAAQSATATLTTSGSWIIAAVVLKLNVIVLQARYSNPLASGDLCGSIRCVATRTVLKGVAQPSPDLAWDSGQVGGLSTNPLPAPTMVNPAAVATYGGRVYAYSADSARLWSAAYSGVGVGSWRAESGIPGLSGPILKLGPPAGSITILVTSAGPMMFVAAAAGSPSHNGVWYAPVNGDGSLGAWTSLPTQPTLNAGAVMVGGGDGATVAWLLCLGTGAADAAFVSVWNPASTAAWTATTNIPAANTQYSAYYDGANNAVIVIGGAAAGVAPGTTIRFAAVTAATGAVGAYTTSGVPLPAGRGQPAIALANGNLYVIGGAAAAGNGTPVTTVYLQTLAHLESATAGVMTVSAHPLPAALAGLAAFSLGSNNLATVGGSTTGAAGGDVTTVQADSAGASDLAAAWSTGSGAVLTAAALGAGGAIVNNPDGTQDITFAFGAFGAAALISGFNYGDQLQLTVYFSDTLAGDVSPAQSVVLKIGAPPIVSAPSTTAPATGLPVVSWSFAAGSGGGKELMWRLQLYASAISSTEIYDSGATAGTANNAAIKAAPALANAVAYRRLIQTQSIDSPVANSTNVGAYTDLLTPAVTPPAAPTTPSIAANTTGGVTLGWAAGGPAYRVYYRITGQPDTGPGNGYFLYADAISGTALNAMDELAFGTSYDFAVSSLSAGQESALLVLGTATPKPPAGANALLHVVGNGVAQQAPFWTEQDGGLEVDVEASVTANPMFSQAAYTGRSGTTTAHALTIKGLTLTTAAWLALLQMLDVAGTGQIQGVVGGAVLYYRDHLGVMYTVIPDHRSTNRKARFVPQNPNRRKGDIYLIEVQNPFANVAPVGGNAQGYRQQSGGRVVSLNALEAAL